VKSEDIEIGKDYHLLPDATWWRGQRSAIAGHGVTRVNVHDGPDRDGDYFVEPLDGRPDRTLYGVHGSFLAPLDEPASEPPLPPSPQDYRLRALKEARALLGEDRCDAVSLVHVAAYIMGEEY
jgi:hypothetical protein